MPTIAWLATTPEGDFALALSKRHALKRAGDSADEVVPLTLLETAESLRKQQSAALEQARAALEKTMAAWGGTCAWHADVRAAIAAIDALKA